jgi:hypothetical protein
VITKVIPPKATTTGSTTSCSFDASGTDEFSYLPFNPAENQGSVAAVVHNNLVDTATLNGVLRTDSNVFLPHQVVVNYEVVGGGGAPGQNIVPVSGLEVKTGDEAPVGFLIFNGVSVSGIAAGSFVRATFHVEGKLLDGSTVHTSEREYLFKICNTAGCGTGGTWGICL